MEEGEVVASISDPPAKGKRRRKRRGLCIPLPLAIKYRCPMEGSTGKGRASDDETAQGKGKVGKGGRKEGRDDADNRLPRLPVKKEKRKRGQQKGGRGKEKAGEEACVASWVVRKVRLASFMGKDAARQTGGKGSLKGRKVISGKKESNGRRNELTAVDGPCKNLGD